jgi:hypothetical protein
MTISSCRLSPSNEIAGVRLNVVLAQDNRPGGAGAHWITVSRKAEIRGGKGMSLQGHDFATEKDCSG